MIRSFLDVGMGRDGVTGRRQFLGQLLTASAGTGALSLGWRDMLVAQADELRRRGKSMILLWMDGGPSHFETFNPKIGSERVSALCMGTFRNDNQEQNQGN